MTAPKKTAVINDHMKGTHTWLSRVAWAAGCSRLHSLPAGGLGCSPARGWAAAVD